MNNKPKHFKKALSTLALAAVLLINPSQPFANEANVVESAQAQSKKATQQPMVNINKSTYDFLLTLKGVGDTKAQAIIAYREQFGDFKSIDELSKVSGIGEKIVEANRARLTL